MNDVDTNGAIFCIIMGLIFALASKQLAQLTSDFYFKLLNTRFSVKGYRISFLGGGILFVIFGILVLLRIIS